MALRTSFTELVGCDVPIQLAPMGGVPTPALIAAVNQAGGGSLHVANRHGALHWLPTDMGRRRYGGWVGGP